MKIRTLLFGAGPGAECYINNTSDSRVFVGILDNDREKSGKTIFGCPVYLPEAIQRLEFDEIVVTTQWALTVKTQLIEELNIEESKIVLPQKNQLKAQLPFYNENSKQLGRKIIKQLNNLAATHAVPLVVDFGTLLGLTRDQDIIEWDDDIDFSAPQEYSKPIEAILLMVMNDNPEFLWELERSKNKQGATTSFQLKFVDTKNQLISFVTSIAFRSTKRNYSIHLPSLGMWFAPEKHFNKIEILHWQSTDIQVPWLHQEYLTFQYGDWRIPKENMKLTDYAHLNQVDYREINDSVGKREKVVVSGC